MHSNHSTVSHPFTINQSPIELHRQHSSSHQHQNQPQPHQSSAFGFVPRSPHSTHQAHKNDNSSDQSTPVNANQTIFPSHERTIHTAASVQASISPPRLLDVTAAIAKAATNPNFHAHQSANLIDRISELEEELRQQKLMNAVLKDSNSKETLARQQALTAFHMLNSSIGSKVEDERAKLEATLQERLAFERDQMDREYRSLYGAPLNRSAENERAAKEFSELQRELENEFKLKFDTEITNLKRTNKNLTAELKQYRDQAMNAESFIQRATDENSALVRLTIQQRDDVDLKERYKMILQRLAIKKFMNFCVVKRALVECHRGMVNLRDLIETHNSMAESEVSLILPQSELRTWIHETKRILYFPKSYHAFVGERSYAQQFSEMENILRIVVYNLSKHAKQLKGTVESFSTRIAELQSECMDLRGENIELRAALERMTNQADKFEKLLKYQTVLERRGSMERSIANREAHQLTNGTNRLTESNSSESIESVIPQPAAASGRDPRSGAAPKLNSPTRSQATASNRPKTANKSNRRPSIVNHSAIHNSTEEFHFGTSESLGSSRPSTAPNNFGPPREVSRRLGYLPPVIAMAERIRIQESQIDQLKSENDKLREIPDDESESHAIKQNRLEINQKSDFANNPFNIRPIPESPPSAVDEHEMESKYNNPSKQSFNSNHQNNESKEENYYYPTNNNNNKNINNHSNTVFEEYSLSSSTADAQEYLAAPATSTGITSLRSELNSHSERISRTQKMKNSIRNNEEKEQQFRGENRQKPETSEELQSENSSTNRPGSRPQTARTNSTRPKSNHSQRPQSRNSSSRPSSATPKQIRMATSVYSNALPGQAKYRNAQPNRRPKSSSGGINRSSADKPQNELPPQHKRVSNCPPVNLFLNGSLYNYNFLQSNSAFPAFEAIGVIEENNFNGNERSNNADRRYNEMNPY